MWITHNSLILVNFPLITTNTAVTDTENLLRSIIIIIIHFCFHISFILLPVIFLFCSFIINNSGSYLLSLISLWCLMFEFYSFAYISLHKVSSHPWFLKPLFFLTYIRKRKKSHLYIQHKQKYPEDLSISSNNVSRVN